MRSLKNCTYIFPYLFCLFFFFIPPAVAADHLHSFLYHRFGDNRYPSTNISLADLSAQMHYLRDHGYQVMRASDVVELLRLQKPLPSKTVVLTVDDAYSSFKSGAMPIFRQFGYPVTLFVNTDSVGSKDYLGWHELRQLAKEGVEIGNHTATHRSLAVQLPHESDTAYRQRVLADLDRAQQAFIRELGSAPQLFAYPYGEYTQMTQKLVEDFGFKAAFAQHSGVTGMGDSLFTLVRTPLAGSFGTLEQMRQKLALRPLSVRRVSPVDTLIIDENPPTLILDILDPQIDLKRMRLFVNGQPGGIVQGDPRHERRVVVRSSKALGEGRSRYILSVPGKEAGTYYSYSQFWLKRTRP